MFHTIYFWTSLYQPSWYTYEHLWRRKPGSGPGKPHCVHIFSFNRNFQISFQNGSTELQPHSTERDCFSQTLTIFAVPGFSSYGWKVVPHFQFAFLYFFFFFLVKLNILLLIPHPFFFSVATFGFFIYVYEICIFRECQCFVSIYFTAPLIIDSPVVKMISLQLKSQYSMLPFKM